MSVEFLFVVVIVYNSDWGERISGSRRNNRGKIPASPTGGDLIPPRPIHVLSPKENISSHNVPWRENTGFLASQLRFKKHWRQFQGNEKW
ncbi:MAG: hypothetical protein N2C14_27410 [Planctomycetales bacterium]